MSSPFFQFKRFTVWHDRCAMKVGTDGVLLGTWCPLSIPSSPNRLIAASPNNPMNILDIGTGSGLIALILAQRVSDYTANHVHIDAIDIDADAVAQAHENFRLSPWSNMLHAHHYSLQEWSLNSSSHYPTTQYNLIVSNPPYFQSSLKNPDMQRATARHTDRLSYSDLIAHASRLLQKDGTFAMILPIEAENEIIKIAQHHQLFPTQITHVHTKPNKPAKRLLISLSHHSSLATLRINSFSIESSNSPRSEDYHALTKDFYL